MTRPVTVFEWHKPDGCNYCEKREIGAGNFHQFGTNWMETDSGIGTYTTAVVEMPDGTVRNVDVELIRFDDDGGD